MHAFLISVSTVALAEIGDRTQLLAIMLAARFRRPWPIVAGILAATLANHMAAGLVGRLFGSFLTPVVLDSIVGVSLIAMALWMLKPDELDAETGPLKDSGVFMVTLTTFFVAEIGDKTQIATIALAAAYPNLLMVVAGTTLGMMISNVPPVFLGSAFSSRLPVKALNYGATVLFAVLGCYFLWEALAHRG